MGHDTQLIRMASLNPEIALSNVDKSQFEPTFPGSFTAALEFASGNQSQSQGKPSKPESSFEETSNATTPLCESYTPGQRYLHCDFGMTVKVEALYWTARAHHLISGITFAGLSSTDQVPPALDRWNFQGEVIRIEPDWDWGWRATAGYTSPCDYWDFFFDWTSFHTSKSIDFDLLQLPGWNPWGHPDTVSGVRLFDLSSKWDLGYDVFSLELGRAFWIGRCLTLRPHFGVSGAFIDQDLKHAFDYEPKDFIPFGSLLDLKCDFSGAGLRSGFTLHFTNGTGFGFYGKISYQLLYGSFKTSLNQVEFYATEIGGNPTEELLIADSHDDFSQGISSFQGILGVNWNRCLCEGRYRFGFNIQWEFNQISDLNKFSHYSHFLSEGFHRQENTSLGFMGITFGGSFDF